MLEKLSSLCAKLILIRDQLVKYLGFPLPELEIIYPICVRGCRKIRDAECLEDILVLIHAVLTLILTRTTILYLQQAYRKSTCYMHASIDDRGRKLCP